MGTSSPHIQSKQSTASTNNTTTSTVKTKSKSRSSNQKQNRLYTKALQPISTPSKTPAPASGLDDVNDSLAICLLGFNSPQKNKNKKKMYDSEYEEEVRKQAVMQEVLPDAIMWKKWEATEAPLRQGRGWYPTLDRHFLELLVISEIHCLSHPLQSYNNPTPSANAERIHRHASRVRRVACDRIGSERLHAYCDRVKEAFEAYVQGGWGQGASEYCSKSDISEDVDVDVDVDSEAEAEAEFGGDLDVNVDVSVGSDIGGEGGLVVSDGDGDEEERGRGLEREGSALKRRDLGPSPPTSKTDNETETETDTDIDGRVDSGEEEDEEMDVSMVVDVSPLASPMPSLSLSATSTSDDEAEQAWDEERDILHKVDLEGVLEVPENEADEENERFSDSGKGKNGSGMEVDIVLGGDDQTPQIHIVTPAQT